MKMKRKTTLAQIIAALALAFLPLLGCEKKNTPASCSAATDAGCSAAAGGGAADKTALLSRGRTVYQANCIACHHTDPKKAGAIGPEIFGSSLELLEARVIQGKYPVGYTPKRPTQMMAVFPQLRGDLPALQAFLNAGN